MNNIYKNLGVWILIGLVLFILFNFINTTPNNSSEISFTDFMAQVNAQKVEEVTLRGDEITGIYVDRSQFQTNIPDYPDLIPILLENGVRIRAQSATQGGLLLAILNSWFPMLLIIGVWLFFMRQ
ncbi:MAG: ATP-dependent metallopeptidase FtsH/Yme1/Tma family protein, partial [SAR324 cluster bacterium]|nr:ATP-dependent metallopeptidase FtsH/Yme1/Tma family protein [SAR324 cluster bacterium]